MKDIIKLFLLIIFLQFNQVYAAENIVYLDIEKLIHSSQAGKIINENIKKNHKTNLDIFEKKENDHPNCFFKNQSVFSKCQRTGTVDCSREMGVKKCIREQL